MLTRSVQHWVSVTRSRRSASDQLGWQRLIAAETEEWRTQFVGYNGGSVEVVGWRLDNTDGTHSLSFWVELISDFLFMRMGCCRSHEFREREQVA